MEFEYQFHLFKLLQTILILKQKLKPMNIKIHYFALSVLLLLGCGSKNENKPIEKETNQDNIMELKLNSSAFEEGGMIPEEFTCDGDNVSPELSWSGAPAETKSFALICEDPDAPAGIWIHWVIYNIPGSEKGLHEGVSADKKLYNGTMQGLNSSGETGYDGPCPPVGTHRYYFKLYALDTILNIEGNVTKDVLLDAMKGHIIAQGQLMAKYTRK